MHQRLQDSFLKFYTYLLILYLYFNIHISHGLSFNSADGVSLHRVYMKEAELKLNTGSTELGNSTRVELSTRVEITAKSGRH